MNVEKGSFFYFFIFYYTKKSTQSHMREMKMEQLLKNTNAFEYTDSCSNIMRISNYYIFFTDMFFKIIYIHTSLYIF